MFKIKKTIIDRYLIPGSFVGIIFYRVNEGGSLSFWKILSYNSETETYTRSEAVDSLYDDISITYTNLYYTHITIKDLIRRNVWKIRRYDF
jgi:hypothetical protein